jgi:ribosome-binding factor A
LRDVGDPRLSSLVVTEVEVTDDLTLARVQVRLLVGDDDAARRKAALSALERVKARLRRGLGPVLRLRRVPDLSFSYDVRPDVVHHVEEILAEIEREKD